MMVQSDKQKKTSNGFDSCLLEIPSVPNDFSSGLKGLAVALFGIVGDNKSSPNGALAAGLPSVPVSVAMTLRVSMGYCTCNNRFPNSLDVTVHEYEIDAAASRSETHIISSTSSSSLLDLSPVLLAE